MAYELDLIEELDKSFKEVSPGKLLSVSMPPSMIKKNKEIYNEGVLLTYNKYNDIGIEMRSILLSQHKYVEFDWLVANILNQDILDIVKNEY
jgi:hypothetical protein